MSGWRGSVVRQVDAVREGRVNGCGRGAELARRIRDHEAWGDGPVAIDGAGPMGMAVLRMLRDAFPPSLMIWVFDSRPGTEFRSAVRTIKRYSADYLFATRVLPQHRSPGGWRVVVMAGGGVEVPARPLVISATDLALAWPANPYARVISDLAYGKEARA